MLLARAEAAGVVILAEAKAAVDIGSAVGMGSAATALARAAASEGGLPGSTALAIAAAAGGGQGSGGPEVVQGGSKWVELRWKTEATTASVLFASCAKKLH